MRILSRPVHRTFIVRSAAVAIACFGGVLTASSAVAQVPQPPSASPPGAFVVDSDQLGKVASSVVPTPPPPPPATTVPTPLPISGPTAVVKKKAKKAKTASTGLRLLDPQTAPAVTAGLPPVAAPASAGASAGGGGATIPDSAWAALRKCESNGNYAINTGNGYYGAYQFAASTWRRLGYSGLPHEASPATQDEAARKLQAQQGWGPWPACTRSLGLR